MFKAMTRKQTPATFKPCLEALEERCLLDANALSPVQSQGAAAQEAGIQAALDVLTANQLQVQPVSTLQFWFLVKAQDYQLSAQIASKEGDQANDIWNVGWGMMNMGADTAKFLKVSAELQENPGDPFLQNDMGEVNESLVHYDIPQIFNGAKNWFKDASEVSALKQQLSAIQSLEADLEGGADFEQQATSFIMSQVAKGGKVDASLFAAALAAIIKGPSSQPTSPSPSPPPSPPASSTGHATRSILTESGIGPAGLRAGNGSGAGMFVGSGALTLNK